MGRKEIDEVALESEYRDGALEFQVEASKNVLNAFNEGYLLGRKHAEYVFGKGDKDED